MILPERTCSALLFSDFKPGFNKGTCTSMFIAALFTIDKLWKQPRCPTIDE
jgi:hypothetical protein